MSDSSNNPLLSTLRWLATTTRFPGSRLATHAETLLLLAVAAQASDVDMERGRFLIQSRDTAKDAALRAHAMRRSLAHYKCDNAAKV